MVQNRLDFYISDQAVNGQGWSGLKPSDYVSVYDLRSKNYTHTFFIFSFSFIDTSASCFYLFLISASLILCSLLIITPSSASFLRPARQIYCPTVSRACWAITTRWKSRLVTLFQSFLVNLRTARLPPRRSPARLCLAETSEVWVVEVVARAVSGLL